MSPPTPLKLPKFDDNFRNYTFVLSRAEFEFAKKQGRVARGDPARGYPSLRDLWWRAAEIRGLLDLAVPAKGQRAKTASSADPRKERASGDAAYCAALEQALVAIVSAWEEFFREVAKCVLNRSSFARKLALRDDEPLKRLAREFRLFEQVTMEFVTKGYDLSRVRLGDAVAKARSTVRWQDLDECKTLMTTLFPDISLADLARDWRAIKRLFKDRNRIVHASGEELRWVEEPDIDVVVDEDGGEKFEIVGMVKSQEAYEIVKDYDSIRIESVLDDLLGVAESLHERLFSTYKPDS